MWYQASGSNWALGTSTNNFRTGHVNCDSSPNPNLGTQFFSKKLNPQDLYFWQMQAYTTSHHPEQIKTNIMWGRRCPSKNFASIALARRAVIRQLDTNQLPKIGQKCSTNFPTPRSESLEFPGVEPQPQRMGGSWGRRGWGLPHRIAWNTEFLKIFPSQGDGLGF